MKRSRSLSIITLVLSLMVLFTCVFSTSALAAVGDKPAHTKNLTDNHDGTYTVSLDVVGDSEKKPNNINVIVIVDTSGSMNSQRMTAAKNAVNSLANSLYAYNTSSEPNTVEMALVRFATSSSVAQQPTNSASTFRTAVNGLGNEGNGGTNWESALQTANGVDFNDDDQTFAIFVSDGNPTFRTTQNGWNDWSRTYHQWGSGQETTQNIERCYTTAVDDAQALATRVTPGNFFTIGAFGNVDRMEQLTTDAGAPAKNYYSASDTAALNQAISDILAKIEMAGIGNTEIDDGTTNQVTTSSGPIKLLEVDTSSFKYYRSGGTHGANEPWATGGEGGAPAATFVNGQVEWDLSSVGVLENGVRYTVTFDCYPSQTTYDIIAQLKNGDISYNDLDPEIKKYITEGYALHTNTNATLSYDDTRDDAGQQTSAYTNPDPVATTSSTMDVTKAWQNELDARAVGSIKMTILMDDDDFHEVTLSDPEWTANNIYISPGIIRNGKVLSGAEGHDFTFAELGPEQYNWELVTPTVHPMIINGTLTMLTMVDDAHPAPSGAQTYTINNKTYYSNGSSAASLDAYNYRRSNLNLRKDVTGEDAPEDATFPFTLTVNNSKASSGSAGDTNSDYYVWFSIYDTKAGATVMDATVSGATGPSSSGYYYAPSGTPITVQMKDGWNLRFTNLPTDTTYTFAEGNLADGFAFNKAELTAGEDSTFSGAQTTTGTVEDTNTSYQVVFTNDYELTDLEITKVWADAKNQDGKRLTADELKAKLTLSPAVEGKEPTVVDNGNDTYTISYTGLPRFNNGTEVEYTVAESAIDGYTTEGSPAKDHGTITNTHTPEVTQVTVKKVWDDNNDIGKIRPASINVQLTADGTASGDPVALNEDNKWTYTWTDLPKNKITETDGKKEVGVLIAYSADEVAVPTGYKEEDLEVETDDDGNTTITITNTYTPTPVKVDPPVQKVITGNDDLIDGGDFTFKIEAVSPTDAPMPENTEIDNSPDYAFPNKPGFYEFGEITFTVPGTYEYKVTESGEVDGVTNDPDAEEGKTLTFTVTDDGKGNLVVSPTTDQVQLSFTNVYDADGEASIVVNKGITGAAWPSGKTLTLTIAGTNAPMPEKTTAELTAAGSVTFGPITYGLEDAGKSYEYTITEDSFGAGWSGSPASVKATVEVTDNGDGTLKTEVTYSPEDAKFTNTYTATGTATLEATKAIEGAAWPEGKTLTLTLAGTESAPMPAEGGETVKLTAAGKATFGEITYSEADAGKTYTYTISEDGFGKGWTASPETITATVAVKDNGDGTLETTVTYTPEDATITNTYKAEGTAVLEATKAIKGAEWPENGKITFTLAGQGGTLPTTKTVELTEPGKATFGAITYTEADAGQTYTYTITEDGFGTGWTGAPASITATVKVIDNGDGTLKTEVTYSPEDATFTNTYEAEGEAVIEVTKAVEGAAWPANKTLTFTLAGQGGTLPEEKTVELSAPGKATFGAITYDESDAGKTYTYTVTENSFGTGWTGSPDSITATVVVTDNGDGTLGTKVTYSPENATFTNTYKATGEAVLEATKAIEGAAWPNGKTLTFTLAGEGGTLPETKTAALTAPGTAKFGAITYTEADAGQTYTYTITEDGFGKGWTGAPEEITATVVVTDNGDGTLATEVTYSPEDKTITNTYKAEGEAVLEATKAIKGAAWPEGKKITFTLSGQGGTLPELNTETLEAPGTATFGAIKYTEADAGQTYTYTITEDGFGTGWTGSPTNITATVEVTDNGDGTLATKITYNPEDKTITNTYVAEGSVILEAQKAIAGAAWPEGKELTFTLAGNNGAPMPAAATKTIKAAGPVTFDTITYSEADAGKTYTYTITEGSLGDGWTGTPASITATVTVTDKGDGTLEAKATYNPADATFTNTYKATGEAVLKAKKALEGAGWPEGKELTFTVDGEGDTLPDPETLTAEGEVTFAAIEYTEADAGKNYVYTISEGNGFGAGWTGSGDVTATVEVTDNGDGTLSTKITYSPADATIINTYEASGEAELEVVKALEGAGWPEGKTLTFTLAGEGGTLPTAKTVTLSAEGTATFDPITYDESDVGKTYTYTISEDGFGDGWTASGDVTATVKVTDNGDGTLATEITYSPENKTITNTYEAKGEAVLEATKAIEGAAWPSGKTITFTLAGEGGTLPETKTVTLSAPGTATFEKITYTEADIDKEYTYTITEDGFGTGWTGDPTEITATVKVEDNGDGTLKTTVTYDLEDKTITNTYVAEGTAVLEVTKTIAPENISWPEGKTLTFTLAGEGGTLPEKTTVDLTAAGKATFDAITYDESDAGKTYTYTITEGSFGNGWTGTPTSITATVVVTDKGDGTLSTEVTYSPEDATFTNTYAATGTAVLEVIKEISGAEWPEGKTLTFTLAGEGGTLPDTKTVELTEAGTATFGAIKYTEADIDKEYTYTISEDGFGTGWTGSGDVTATVEVTDNGDGTLSTEVTYNPTDKTIKNTYKAKGEATINVTKAIEGDTWPEGKTLTFTLSGSDPMPATTTATLSAPGTVSFGPINYNESHAGKEFTYTIKEDGFGGAWTKSGDVTATVKVTDNGDGTLKTEVSYSPNATITNTYERTQIDVTKVWNDNHNQDGLRPTTDEFKSMLILKAGDTDVTDRYSNNLTVTDNGDDTYTATWVKLDKYLDGAEIKYSVDENEIKGYTKDITGTVGDDGKVVENSFTIYNTHKPFETVVHVSKIWSDNNDKWHKRSLAGATVQLYAQPDGGDKIEVDEPVAVGTGNDWSYTWEHLPVYEDGKQIIYSVTETLSYDKYKKSGDDRLLPAKEGKDDKPGDSGTITITNKYDEDSDLNYKFTFYKRWEGEQLPEIDWKLYDSNGNVVKKLFDVNKKSNPWEYKGWFPDYVDYYVVEEVPAGYKVRYENVGTHADVTDRCYNGGTIVNYKVPKTGDGAKPVLWIGCVLAGLALLGGVVYTRKRRKNG